MKTQNIVLTVLAVGLIGLGLYVFTHQSSSQPVGAVSGGDFYNQVREFAGEVNATQLATTSLSTAETVTANEFIGWTNSAMVSYTPIATAADTITFPASSTIKSIVPNPGDSQNFCFRNATSTANIYLTIAGNTGVNLIVASSSVSAVGSKVVVSGKIACFRLIREPATATTFDIDALMTTFN